MSHLQLFPISLSLSVYARVYRTIKQVGGGSRRQCNSWAPRIMTTFHLAHSTMEHSCISFGWVIKKCTTRPAAMQQILASRMRAPCILLLEIGLWSAFRPLCPSASPSPHSWHSACVQFSVHGLHLNADPALSSTLWCLVWSHMPLVVHVSVCCWGYVLSLCGSLKSYKWDGWISTDRFILPLVLLLFSHQTQWSQGKSVRATMKKQRCL